MNRQKPITRDLENLVERLALNIQSYPETDEETIIALAQELDESLIYGQKQEGKDILMQRLGYGVEEGEAKGSIETISKNIIYLINLGVEDIGKVVSRFPAVLSYDIKENSKPTFEYLINNLRATIQDIVPNLLSYSLELRIKPRYLFFKSKNMGNRYKASSLLLPSDKKLMERTGQDIKEFNEFKIKYYDGLIPEAIAQKKYRLAKDACNYAKRCTDDTEKIKEYERIKGEIKADREKVQQNQLYTKLISSPDTNIFMNVFGDYVEKKGGQLIVDSGPNLVDNIWQDFKGGYLKDKLPADKVDDPQVEERFKQTLSRSFDNLEELKEEKTITISFEF